VSEDPIVLNRHNAREKSHLRGRRVLGQCGRGDPPHSKDKNWQSTDTEPVIEEGHAE